MMTPVEVITSDTLKSVVIDHDNYAHRQWLGKMCFWAMRNGVTVTTKPTDLPVTFVEQPKKGE